MWVYVATFSGRGSDGRRDFGRAVCCTIDVVVRSDDGPECGFESAFPWYNFRFFPRGRTASAWAINESIARNLRIVFWHEMPIETCEL